MSKAKRCDDSQVLRLNLFDIPTFISTLAYPHILNRCWEKGEYFALKIKVRKENPNYVFNTLLMDRLIKFRNQPFNGKNI